MISGAGLSILGLFLLFPGQSLPALFQLVPKLTHVGTFLNLMGLGAQLISIAALPALEDIHVGIARRRNTRKSKSQDASLWIISWMLAVYAGHLVALLVMKFMSYIQGGWMVAGCSGISVSICLVLEVLRRSLSPISRCNNCENKSPWTHDLALSPVNRFSKRSWTMFRILTGLYFSVHSKTTHLMTSKASKND